MITPEQAKKQVEEFRENNPSGRVVWTNGVFDLFHAGHRFAIEQCAERGDLLVVGINSDRSVRELKGPERPKWDEKKRAACLEEHPDVDIVVLFDEIFPEETINTVDPDVVCKGKEYRGKRVAGSEGRAVFFHRRKEGVSTTRIIEEPEDTYLHMFWSGPEFNLAKYLAIRTAINVHKPASTVLWTVLEPFANPYWEALRRSGVQVRQAAGLLGEDLMRSYQRMWDKIWEEMSNYHPTAQAAQIKDLCVWRALDKYGGMFLDMDTISYRPFWEEFVESGKDFLLCGPPATGVVAATAESDVPAEIARIAEDNLERPHEFDDRWYRWALCGPTALTQYIKNKQLTVEDPGPCFIAPNEWFYAYYDDLDKFFDNVDIPEDARIFHLYGEGRNEMTNSTDPDELITEEFVKNSSALYARVAREVLEPTDPIINDAEKTSRPVVDVEAPSGEYLSPGDVVNIPIVEQEDGLYSGRKVVLTAIMKNEEENFEDAMTTILPLIDRWIILDTGSEDNTLEVAKEFFAKHNIPEIPDDNPLQAPGYKIYQDEFKGYTKSRQQALNLSYKHAGADDYIAKHDLDERLHGAKWLRRAVDQHDRDVIYVFCFQEDDMRFAFPRLWHARTEATYVRRDHEVLSFPGASEPPCQIPPKRGTEGECWVRHLGGGRNREGVADTIMRLMGDVDKACSEGRRDWRSEFYIGRDCRCISLRMSENWLKRRIESSKGGHTQQEKFFALLYLGDVIKAQGRAEEAIPYWERAHSLYPEARASREPLVRIGNTAYQIADNCEDEDMVWWEKCRDAYRKAAKITSPPDMILFVEEKLYGPEFEKKIRWQGAIAEWHLNTGPEGARRAMELVEPLEDIEEDHRLRESVQHWKNLLND